MPFCWLEGGEEIWVERTVVSIFSSSRAALRLAAQKPPQHCHFQQRPPWSLWWRGCDTPGRFSRLPRGPSASWKPGRRRRPQPAVSQHHAGPLRDAEVIRAPSAYLMEMLWCRRRRFYCGGVTLLGFWLLGDGPVWVFGVVSSEEFDDPRWSTKMCHTRSQSSFFFTKINTNVTKNVSSEFSVLFLLLLWTFRLAWGENNLKSFPIFLL